MAGAVIMADSLIPSIRLPDALDTLQMLATVATSPLATVVNAAPRAEIAPDRRVGLRKAAADYRAIADALDAAAAAASLSATHAEAA